LSEYFKDYIWKNGIPLGLQSTPPSAEGGSYKIVSDPYRKRISIEKYLNGAFSNIVYDSALLNFRHLKNPEQTAWQKSLETPSRCLIRNEDDRLLFIETYQFKDHLCIECQVQSPHGLDLSLHKMHYILFGDSFNGVILYDINHHPVMFKHYEFDEHNKQFTKLLKEVWDMTSSEKLNLMETPHVENNFPSHRRNP
jgi:hypothetical protein